MNRLQFLKSVSGGIASGLIVTSGIPSIIYKEDENPIVKKKNPILFDIGVGMNVEDSDKRVWNIHNISAEGIVSLSAFDQKMPNFIKLYRRTVFQFFSPYVPLPEVKVPKPKGTIYASSKRRYR